jgi:hypothetical protein
MRDAIGDEVNTTPAATSSDVPMRPVGFRPIAMLNRSAFAAHHRMLAWPDLLKSQPRLKRPCSQGALCGS